MIKASARKGDDSANKTRLENEVQSLVGSFDFAYQMQEAIRDIVSIDQRFLGMDFRYAQFEADVEIGKICTAGDLVLSQDTDMLFAYLKVQTQLVFLENEWRVFEKMALMDHLKCSSAVKLCCIAAFSGNDYCRNVPTVGHKSVRQLMMSCNFEGEEDNANSYIDYFLSTPKVIKGMKSSLEVDYALDLSAKDIETFHLRFYASINVALLFEERGEYTTTIKDLVMVFMAYIGIQSSKRHQMSSR